MSTIGGHVFKLCMNIYLFANIKSWEYKLQQIGQVEDIVAEEKPHPAWKN